MQQQQSQTLPLWQQEVRSAAEGGDVQRLRQLEGERGTAQWAPHATALAAKGGHLESLRFLHEHGVLWDETVTAEAAFKGHLACLKYAHENGAPWCDTVTASAAANGHTDCLRYAHEHGAPWDSGTSTFARPYAACRVYCKAHDPAMGRERDDCPGRGCRVHQRGT